MTKVLMWVNLVLTFVWMVLIFPTMFWWKESILWVAMMSIWANVASHFAGYIAGRTEVQAQKGYNLTEADREWILLQLILITKTNSSTSQTQIHSLQTLHPPSQSPPLPTTIEVI